MTASQQDTFFLIDVETANADYASICQVGVVQATPEGIVDEWSSYVDPEDYFDAFNVSMHGIDTDRVLGAPNFKSIHGELHQRLSKGLVLSYSWFDRSSIWQAHDRHSLETPTYEWLDATRLVRRTWPAVSKRGFALKKVAKMLGIKMDRHHDALSDARAAAHVVIETLRVSGVGLTDWRERAYQPITKDAKAGDMKAKVRPDGAPIDGPLMGEMVVFTGELSITRREAMEKALLAGADVGDSVTKNTTVVVFGQQDAAKLNETGKSAKQRKAEALIAAGQEIELINEQSFFRSLQLESSRN